MGARKKTILHTIVANAVFIIVLVLNFSVFGISIPNRIIGLEDNFKSIVNRSQSNVVLSLSKENQSIRSLIGDDNLIYQGRSIRYESVVWNFLNKEDLSITFSSDNDSYSYSNFAILDALPKSDSSDFTNYGHLPIAKGYLSDLAGFSSYYGHLVDDDAIYLRRSFCLPIAEAFGMTEEEFYQSIIVADEEEAAIFDVSLSYKGTSFQCSVRGIIDDRNSGNRCITNLKRIESVYDVSVGIASVDLYNSLQATSDVLVSTLKYVNNQIPGEKYYLTGFGLMEQAAIRCDAYYVSDLTSDETLRAEAANLLLEYNSFVPWKSNLVIITCLVCFDFLIVMVFWAFAIKRKLPKINFVCLGLSLAVSFSIGYFIQYLIGFLNFGCRGFTITSVSGLYYGTIVGMCFVLLMLLCLSKFKSEPKVEKPKALCEVTLDSIKV